MLLELFSFSLQTCIMCNTHEGQGMQSFINWASLQQATCKSCQKKKMSLQNRAHTQIHKSIRISATHIQLPLNFHITLLILQTAVTPFMLFWLVTHSHTGTRSILIQISKWQIFPCTTLTYLLLYATKCPSCTENVIQINFMH